MERNDVEKKVIEIFEEELEIEVASLRNWCERVWKRM